MSLRLAPAILLLVPLAARADPPAVNYVKIEDKGGKLVAPVTVIKYQTAQQTVTVIENGQPATRTVTQVVPLAETEYRVLNAEAGEFFPPSGEKLDPKKLGDVLRAGAILAVSRDGQPIDPAVGKANKELVAVLVPKGVAVAKADPPKDLAEEKPFATQASVKDGAVVVVRDVVTRQKVQQQQKKVTADGKPFTAVIDVEVPVTQREAVTLDPKRTQVLRFDGTEVPPADWGSVLKEKAKVIVAPGGKAIPDELRAAHKDAVAVLVIKAK